MICGSQILQVCSSVRDSISYDPASGSTTPGTPVSCCKISCVARATRADAAHGLLDIRRLGDMLARIKGRIIHRALDHVSPLAVPVMLEIGRESVSGEASEALLAEAEAELVKEAMQ